MSIRRIVSLLVGIAFVGGAISAYLFAPMGSREAGVGLILLAMFTLGLIMTWKGVWGEDNIDIDDE